MGARQVLDVSGLDQTKKDFIEWRGEVYQECEAIVLSAASNCWKIPAEQVTDDMLIGDDYICIAKEILDKAHQAKAVYLALFRDPQGIMPCVPGSRTTIRWMVLCLAAERCGLPV